MAASRVRKAGQAHTLPRTEQDIPIGMVALVSLLCLHAGGGAALALRVISGLGSKAWELAVGGVIFVAIMSFFVSAVCGYMAGLIGSSNSPLSGIGILVVVICALLLVYPVKVRCRPAARQGAGGVRAVRHLGGVRRRRDRQQQPAGSEDRPARRCDALACSRWRWSSASSPARSSFRRCSICSITPMASSARPGGNPAHALPAPQAGLISALAQGVIQNNVDWSVLRRRRPDRRGLHRVRRGCCAARQRQGGVPAAARRRSRHLPADRRAR